MTRYRLSLVLLPLILLLLFVLHISIGKVVFTWSDWMHFFSKSQPNDDIFKQIIFYNRIPTAITAIIAGAALSVSGMQMQTLFRNPVAGPFVLGISSGASLFVALFLLSSSFIGISFFDFLWLQHAGIILCAFIGSFLFALLILYISTRVKSVSTVLIIGLLLSGVASAAVTLLESLADKNALQSFVFWSFGSFQNMSYEQVGIFSFTVLLGLFLAMFSLKPSNLLQINEVFAQQNGIHIQRTKSLLIISSTLLASAVTAYCGPIAFVGLAVPHLCRNLLQSSDHIRLFPFVCLIGSIVCLACSLLTNLPFVEINIPINVITSIIGGPVVIYIILKKPIEYR